MKLKSIFLVTITIGSFAIVSCNNNNSNEKANSATEQTANATYQCPMKCEGEKTYDKPGNCPVCNMELQKVK